jgi:hypothetical protein
MEYFYKEFSLKRKNDYFCLYSEEFGIGFTFSNFRLDFQLCGDFTRIDIELDRFGLESFIMTHAIFLDIDIDNCFNDVRFKAVVSEKDIECLFSRN